MPSATASRLNWSSHCSKLAPRWQLARCASAGVAASSASNATTMLERCNGLHLDQERLLHQPVDHQQRIRRIGAVREELRKLALAVSHEFRNVLRVNQIGGELHDIAPTSADRLQRRLDVGVDQGALRVEIFADLAVVISPNLSGDEYELGRFHARDLRILSERLAKRVGAEDLDLGHGCLGFNMVRAYSRPDDMR